jgi:hypothetical protein
MCDLQTGTRSLFVIVVIATDAADIGGIGAERTGCPSLPVVDQVAVLAGEEARLRTWRFVSCCGDGGLSGRLQAVDLVLAGCGGGLRVQAGVEVIESSGQL